MVRARVQTLRLLVMAALVVTVTGACSDPEPGAKVQRSSSTPTATSSSTPTKLTAEQEVEAAVRTYYAEVTRASRTADSTRLKQLVHKTCPCQEFVQAIDAMARKKEHSPDVVWTIQKIKVHNVERGTADAEVRYTVNSYKVVDSQGKTLAAFPKSDGRVDLIFSRQADGSWLLNNLVDLEDH